MMDFHFNGPLGTDGSFSKITKRTEASDLPSNDAPVSPGHDEDDNPSS